MQAFESGDEVRGQALYWASLHTYLADRLAANAALRAAVKVVRFEDLCRAPRETLSALFQHCDLPDSGVPIAEAAGRRSEEHTSELQSLMRISYAVFCLKKKKQPKRKAQTTTTMN